MNIVSEHIWTYPNLSERTWTYLNISEHIQQFLNVSQLFWMFSKTWMHQDNKMNVGTQESPSNSKICFIIERNRYMKYNLNCLKKKFSSRKYFNPLCKKELFFPINVRHTCVNYSTTLISFVSHCTAISKKVLTRI